MVLAGCVLALSLTGVASVLAARTPPGSETSDDGERGRLFLSPMGEPFRRGADPAAAWFAGADMDKDGRLTRAEMRADALRFFATLDADHDGEIGPDEIDRYEQAIAPEIGGGAFDGGGLPRSGSGPRGRRDSRGGGGHRGGGGERPSGGEDEAGGTPAGPTEPAVQGAARYSYLALPEPVIAADADLNGGVSRAEFTQAADRRFRLLDADADGLITPEELPKLAGRSGGSGQGRHRPPRAPG